MARWPQIGDEVTFDVWEWPRRNEAAVNTELTATIIAIEKYRNRAKKYVVTSPDPEFVKNYPFKSRRYTGEPIAICYRQYHSFKTFGPPTIDTEEKLTRLLERQYG